MPTRAQMIVEEIKHINDEAMKRIVVEQEMNPLAAYSTRQLKEELKRRDRQRLEFPTDYSGRYDFPRKMFS